MSKTALSSRQVILRTWLEQLIKKSDYDATTDNKPAQSSQLDDLLESIEKNLEDLLRLSATDPASLTINVGPSKIQNTFSDRTRSIPHIGKAFVEITSGSIVLPASSGGNITISPGSPQALTISNSNYKKLTIYLDASGNLGIVQSAEDTIASNITPVPAPSGTLPVGYITVSADATGNINTIAQTDIVQFSVGGGGGTGTGDANSFVETLKNRLNDSIFEAVTPYVASQDADNSPYVDTANSTGSYDLAEGAFKFTNSGETLVTENLLDSTFLSSFDGLNKAEAIVKWRDGSIDTGATYEISRDGGNVFDQIIMTRVDDSGTYRGILNEFSSVASFDIGTGFSASINVVKTQSDGKILVGGTFSAFNGNTRKYLVRLNSDGTEDTAFYTNLGSGFNNSIEAIAIQSDGKILVGGVFTSLNGNTRNYLVRLNSDGTEDTAFYTNLGSGFNSYIKSIWLQSDGKILVGGNFTSLNGNTRNYFVRLNSDGTEDTAFYTNLGSGFDNIIYATNVQSDGKILVGGVFSAFNGNTRKYLVRLNSDGTEDTAFYTNLGSGFGNVIRSITIQSDGKIVAGGGFISFNGNTRNYLVRLNSDGTEDTAFYTNLGSGFNASVFETNIQPDGKILVGGAFTAFNSNIRNFLVRLNSDGTEDTAFYTNLGSGFNASVSDTDNTQDGNLIIGGVFGSLNGNTVNRLVKLRSDGNLYTGSDTTLDSITSGTSQAQSLNGTTQAKLATTFTLSNKSQVSDVKLNIDSFTGTIANNNGYISIQIVKDSAGLPSTDPNDIIAESALIKVSTLSIGELKTTFKITLPAGTYHIVVTSDATYKNDFASGSINFAGYTSGNGLATYDEGTGTWTNQDPSALYYTVTGFVLDMRLRVTSSIAGVLLDGYGVYYEENIANLAYATTVDGITRVTFQAVADNLNEFVMPFVVNPDLLVVYQLGDGKTYRHGDFSVQGTKVVFPDNFFQNGGVEKTQTLVFDQLRGGAFDNSDVNASLLAANHLGSVDGSIDRSAPGRGILLRRPDGTLREITIDDSDNIVIYSV